MKEPEELLKEIPLAPVPDALDRRVEQLIQGVDTRVAASPVGRPPVWASLAACIACVAAGFCVGTWKGRPAAAAKPPVVAYLVRPAERPTQPFNAGKAAPEKSFFERKAKRIRGFSAR